MEAKNIFLPLVLRDLEISWMTSTNNRAPLLCYFKLCASFQSHLRIQIGVTVRKCSILVKIDDCFVPCDLEICWTTINKASLKNMIAATGLVIVDFSAHVTLKFDGWPRKKIGHLFYTTSSFVHHLKSISEFKLELQSRNAQFGSKSIFWAAWPCNLTYDLEKR